MTTNKDLDKIPGRTGPEEERAATLNGGFAWSLERATEYGDVCRTTYRGQDAVLLTGEAGLRAFYDTQRVVRRGTKSESDVAFLSDGSTTVVPVMDGAEHIARKVALLATMTPSALNHYRAILADTVDRYVAKWTQMRAFDAKSELQQFSFEALSTVITGSAGEVGLAADFGEATLGLLGDEPAKRLPARDRLLAWYRRALEEQRSKPTKDAQLNVIGILAHHTNLSDMDIVAEVQHIFIASGGVWAAACTALALLATHPEAMNRARVAAQALSPALTLRELDTCTPLQLLVEEVARWTPFTNSQVGKAEQTFEVNGYTIPAGTLLIAGLFATNHSPALYPSPLAFDPQRAERESSAGVAACPYSVSRPYGYAPFGGGDRTNGHRCLGEPLLYMAVKLFLARILRAHTWELASPETVTKAPAPYLAERVELRFRAIGDG